MLRGHDGTGTSEPRAGIGSAPDMTLHLYDTARRAVVPFEPGPIVTMYTCGITPYDATHLGHAAVYVGYDVLQRRLRDLGHETRCVRNVTDVDDDILRKARELGMHYLDLAAAEMARFDDDMRALGMLAAWSEPRATSAIADIRRFIGDVLERGHAYQSGGAVYFDVGSFAGFGEISGYDRDTMVALAAERGGNPDDPAKRDPLDFVLWQPSAPDEPAWDSAWGPGRPGWHIECSTLAMRELESATIDLHGGGADLIFPHHECERAQSEAATGRPFVRHWMHQAMVRMDGEKMSKSLGNLVFVSDLRSVYDPRAIRLGIVAHHYRDSWEWNDTIMPTAAERLERWIAAGPGDGGLEAARACLDADLDTRGAIEAIDDAVRAGAGVSAAAALLGVDTSMPVGLDPPDPALVSWRARL
jgi:L-cysteine:1D-myo-inositol 2-amino-2-deoxy-alpha-D-glucopyranoside ligase